MEPDVGLVAIGNHIGGRGRIFDTGRIEALRPIIWNIFRVSERLVLALARVGSKEKRRIRSEDIPLHPFCL